MSARSTLQIVVTLGQSLSQGSTANSALRVMTRQPPNAQQLLTLDFGPTHNGALGWGPTAARLSQFEGFEPLVEGRTETHVSGMMTALLASYVEAGRSPPTLLHINNGAGGRSILELMTSQSDIYADLQSGLAATAPRDIIAIPATNGYYDFYLRTVDGAEFQGNMEGPIVFFDNLADQLRIAVDHARSLGFDVAPKVVLNFIQGQSDGSPNYDLYLNELIDNFNGLLSSIVAPDANALIVVSQTRGYGDKSISLDQLQVINQRDDVVFGASEFEYQVRFPIGSQGGGTHLDPEGYYVMGQRIGRNIFAALEGAENAPLLIGSVTQTGARTLIVEFTGVDNHLVRDESIFSVEDFIRPPSNMGFFAYNSSGRSPTPFEIENAEIVSQNQVLLTFASDISGEFLLMLGRTPEDLRLPGSEWGSARSWGGTTIRDAGRLDVMVPVDGSALADPFLYEFAPIQSVIVRANHAPSMPRSLSIRVAENLTHVTDVNATDDVDAEGSGLRYFLADTLDGHLFDINPLTGALSFKSVPNFEGPSDSDNDNRYQVRVGVKDSLNVSSYSAVTVQVLDANEAPSGIIISNDAVTRLSHVGHEIGTVSAIDEDANSTFWYSIVRQDANLFSIDPGTGALRISDGDALRSFPQSSVRVTIEATDASRLFVQHEFVIQLAGDPVMSPGYVGTEGSDVFTHRAATAWRAEGRGGDDRLTGSALNDLVFGGDGDDTLVGLAGNDELWGEHGNDVLDGGEGDDRLIGGAGNDRLIGGPGVDVLLGGAGNDTYFIDHAGDLAIEADHVGNDSGGNDRVHTTVSLNSGGLIERITASGVADIDINGSSTNELIEGNSGNNRLFGAAGNDTIVGGSGSDLIIGGTGIDVMTGGSGADVFVFDSVFEAGDRVTDFESGIDKIFIARSVLQGAVADGPLDPAVFALGLGATDSEHRFIFNPNSRRLFFDPDGVGGTPQQEVAILSGVSALRPTDIIIG